MVCDWEPIDALVHLLVLTDAERELWVDNRIVGVSILTLGEREGLTKQAISLRLKVIDAKLANTRRRTVLAA